MLPCPHVTATSALLNTISIKINSSFQNPGSSPEGNAPFWARTTVTCVLRGSHTVFRDGIAKANKFPPFMVTWGGGGGRGGGGGGGGGGTVIVTAVYISPMHGYETEL